MNKRSRQNAKRNPVRETNVGDEFAWQRDFNKQFPGVCQSCAMIGKFSQATRKIGVGDLDMHFCADCCEEQSSMMRENGMIELGGDQ